MFYFHLQDDCLQNLQKHIENDSKSEWHQLIKPRIIHLQNLLSSLQCHLLADYFHNPRTTTTTTTTTEEDDDYYEDDILIKHLRCLLPLATEIFKKFANILEKHPSALDLLFNIILESVAGAMLMKIINSLLILPLSFTKSVLDQLLLILEPLSRLNKFLPESVLEEDGQTGTETPTLAQLTDQSWVWLIDLERTCSLLIGQCLGTILVGLPQFHEEIACGNWLQNPIFSKGLLPKLDVDLEVIYAIAYTTATNSLPTLYETIDNLPNEQQTYCKLALNVPCQYDEACAVHGDETAAHNFYETMLETHITTDDEIYWNLDETQSQLLERVLRCFLICALKHMGLLKRDADHGAVREVYRSVLDLRMKLVESFNALKYGVVTVGDEEIEDGGCGGQQMEPYVIEGDVENYRSRMLVQKMLQRCLFVLLFVKGECVFFSKSTFL